MDQIADDVEEKRQRRFLWFKKKNSELEMRKQKFQPFVFEEDEEVIFERKEKKRWLKKKTVKKISHLITSVVCTTGTIIVYILI